MVHELIFLLPYPINMLWNGTIPDVPMQAGGQSTISQMFGTEVP